MADRSDIEWTDATWNPITGCAIVSPGCTNCYAMRLAGGRLRHIPSRKGLTRASRAGPVWTGEVRFTEGWLEQPLKWRRPRKIFVCAHGDLYAEGVPDAWIDRVFAVMQQAAHHEYQVLTKRPGRMVQHARRVWMSRKDNGVPAIDGWANGQRYVLGPVKLHDEETWRAWPLPNVLLGVSVERQAEANARRPALLELAAAGWRTFVSYEPALGPIDWRGWEFLSWLISGGESGPGARPSHPDWHRAARNFAHKNGIAYLFKQWGAWAAVEPGSWNGEPHAVGSTFTPNLQPGDKWFGRDGYLGDKPPRIWAPAEFAIMRRVGKHAAGRLLDGKVWSEWPADLRPGSRVHPTSNLTRTSGKPDVVGEWPDGPTMAAANLPSPSPAAGGGEPDVLTTTSPPAAARGRA